MVSPLVCRQYMKIRDDALDLDDGVTTPSTPLRGCVSGKGYGLIGLLAKAIKVAGQFVDMNIPATVSKYGGYREDTFADLVVSSSGIDADFLSRSSEREQQSAVAASQKGEAVFLFSGAHPMFFRNQWKLIVMASSGSKRLKCALQVRISTERNRTHNKLIFCDTRQPYFSYIIEKY